MYLSRPLESAYLHISWKGLQEQLTEYFQCGDISGSQDYLSWKQCSPRTFLLSLKQWFSFQWVSESQISRFFYLRGFFCFTQKQLKCTLEKNMLTYKQHQETLGGTTVSQRLLLLNEIRDRTSIMWHKHGSLLAPQSLLTVGGYDVKSL